MREWERVAARCQVLDHVPQGAFVLRQDWVVLFWNRCIEDWTRVSRQEIVGQPIHAFYSSLRAPKYAARLHSVFAGGPPVIFSSQLHGHIIPIKTHDGQFRIQHTTVTSLSLEGSEACYALFSLQDVTDLTHRVRDYKHMRDVALEEVAERKRVEEVQREHAARTQAILNAAVDGIVTIDEYGMIDSFNPAAERLFGYSAEEVIGRNVAMLMPPPWCHQHDGYLAMYRRVGRGKLASTPREVVGQRKNGTTFPMELSVSEVCLEGRRLLTGMTRDITERQAMERMKDDFVSVVSHELRTPLTSIRGALGLLSNHLLDPLPEKAQHLLDIAVRNSDRLVRLVNDILDLERITSGRVAMAKQACEAGALMRQALEEVQAMAEQAGVTLRAEPPRTPLWFCFDSDRILQTLTNLLSNAIKFSPPGTTVWVRAVRHETEAVFHVQDQGRGIPAEKLDMIFERFQQVDASDAREKGGTGLGLTICRSIVQQHGGRIWVESLLGKGSTFFFALPLVAEPGFPLLEPHVA